MQLPTWRMVKKVSSSVGLGGSEAGNSPDAEERNLRELAGPEPLERPLLRRVLEVPVKSLHLGDVVGDPVEDRAVFGR